MLTYFLCLVLFCVGLYAVLRKRNIIKIIIGIGIIEYAVNLFFVLGGYRIGSRSPIEAVDQVILNKVDPMPQAFASVSIVVGLALTVLLVTVGIRIYEKYGTFDITRINKLKG